MNNSITYKMRAECRADVGKFIQAALVDTLSIEPYLNDVWVIVTFTSPHSLDELKYRIEAIRDSYVMLNTVAQIDDYTGQCY